MSLGQISEKHCVLSIGHSFDPKFMKLFQNVNPYEIELKFKSRSCWDKN